MPASRKSAPKRPPIRAKSALPAPRVTQERVHIPWQQRPAIRILAAIVALVVLVLVAVNAERFWHHHTTTTRNKAAVKKYDTDLQGDFLPLSDVFNQSTTMPETYLTGGVTQTAYVSATAQWLSTFQTLEHKITSANPPQPMGKARALLDQGVVVFTDAMRLFQTAATAPDAATKKALVAQGNNILAHAEAVFADGAQEEAVVVHDYGLPLPSGVNASSLTGLPSVPDETVTVTPSPSPTP